MVIDKFDEILDSYPDFTKHLNIKKDVFAKEGISLIFCINNSQDALHKFARYCGDIFSFVGGNILKLESQDTKFLNKFLGSSNSGSGRLRVLVKNILNQPIYSSSLQMLNTDKIKLEKKLMTYLEDAKDASYTFNISSLEYLLNIFYTLGKYEEASNFFESYLLSRLSNFDDKIKARFRVSYSDFLVLSGKDKAALKELAKVEQYLVKDDTLKSEYLTVKLSIYYSQENYAEAEKLSLKAL